MRVRVFMCDGMYKIISVYNRLHVSVNVSACIYKFVHLYRYHMYV